MRAIRSYQDGGSLFEMDRATERRLNREYRKSLRQQRAYDRRYQQEFDKGTPSNPRFMTGAPNVTPEDYTPSFTDQLMLLLTGGQSRPKIKNRGRGRGMTTGGRRKLGRAITPGCEGGFC